MDFEDLIAVNQVGQGVRDIEALLRPFYLFTEDEKRKHLLHLSHLLWQSKPLDSDIAYAISASSLRPTFIPCVLLQTKGLKTGLAKILNLPADELVKSYRLLLFLFKCAYLRRFEAEKNHPDKWWYSDLSREETVQFLLSGR
jgi:hypothetical protein